MTEPLNTSDYRDATSGKGPLADQWADKPHRLVYDLCAEVERLRKTLEVVRDAAARLDKAIDARRCSCECETEWEAITDSLGDLLGSSCEMGSAD